MSWKAAWPGANGAGNTGYRLERVPGHEDKVVYVDRGVRPARQGNNADMRRR